MESKQVWFYVRNRQQDGPVSTFELIKMFEQGVLNKNTLIWSKEMEVWQTAESLHIFTDLFTKNPLPLKTTDSSPLYFLPEYHSLIRYIARMFDLTLFSLVLGIFLSIFSTDIFVNQSHGILGMLTLSLWVAVEPIILIIFGNTLGKALLNTKIRTINGENIDYLTALKRSVYIWSAGMGLGIPVLSFLFSIVSHFKSDKIGMLPWDKKYGTVILHGKIEAPQFLLAVLLPIALFSVGFFLGKI